MDKTQESLTKLVEGTSAGLRKNIKAAIKSCRKKLKEMRYEYDAEAFPALPKAAPKAPTTVPQKPRSLAEMFIWKQVDWTKYAAFVGYYLGQKQPSENDAVVHYAFAQHLRNRAQPIFDQHTLRAAWALGLLDHHASEAASRWLVKEKKKGSDPQATEFTWRDSGTDTRGGSGLKSLHGYQRAMASLLKGADDAQALLLELDQVLMPLGQAIKKVFVDPTQMPNWIPPVRLKKGRAKGNASA